MNRKHNFGAGPGILPESALQKAAADILNFNNSGMGVLEISHRSKDFEAVLQKAKSLVKELLNVPDTHEVLFLQGGANATVWVLNATDKTIIIKLSFRQDKNLHLKRIILMLTLIAAGILIVALPDSGKRIFSISRDHGPTLQDAMGLVLGAYWVHLVFDTGMETTRENLTI